MFSFGEWFDELAAKVCNWGRWGADDEIGTINLVTPEAIRRGVGCVHQGRPFSLALPLSEPEGIQLGFVPGRVNPLRAMTQLHVAMADDPDGPCVNDDVVTMGLQAATHWDGLAHVSYQGKLYNGYPADSVTCFGAGRTGISRIRSLVSRGVLLDVARAKGTERLDGGSPVTADDLDAAADLARVTVQAGDIVLIRTGQVQYLHQRRPDKMGYAAPSPGPSVASVGWFRDHDVAAVATDNLTFEVWPWQPEDSPLAVHVLHLNQMGMTQGQNWDLEALAADCADDGVYQFLLEASPQPFTGAVGSPVNPVAIK